MKIVHLEDFSNNVEVLKDFKYPSIVMPNTGVNTLRSEPQSQADRSVGGGYIWYLLNGNRPSGNTNSRSFKIDVSSGDNKLTLFATDNSHSPLGAPINASFLDAGIVVSLSRAENIRKICSFEFTYVGDTGTSELLIIDSIQSTTSPPQVAMAPIPGQKIKVEYIHDSNGMKIYLDNKLTYTGPGRTTPFNLIIGKRPTNNNTSMSPFSLTIENLIIVEVPDESPIRRLSNARVKSVRVSELNGVEQSASDPINVKNILTSTGVSLIGSNAVKFSKVGLGDNERILGSETTMTVKSDNAEKVTTKLLNGDEVLQSKDFDIDSVLQSRLVIGDTVLPISDDLTVQINVTDLMEG